MDRNHSQLHSFLYFLHFSYEYQLVFSLVCSLLRWTFLLVQALIECGNVGLLRASGGRLYRSAILISSRLPTVLVAKG